MVTAKAEYNINPRFVPDSIAVWYGSSKDAAVVYDGAAKEWTVQTTNAAGALQDRFTIEAETNTPTIVFNDAGIDQDLRIEGDTEPNLLFVDAGNDRIGIGTNSPEVLLNLINGSAGTVSPNLTGTMLALESSGAIILQLLSSSISGLAIGAGTNLPGRGRWLYDQGTPQGWQMYIGNADTIHFEDDTPGVKIVTQETDATLTLESLTGTAGKIQINADQVGFFGVTPVARAAAYTPTNVTTDRSYDADASSVAELADVLGTLIADLQAYGLLQ